MTGYVPAEVEQEECVICDLPSDYVRRMRNWAKSIAEMGIMMISSIYDGEFSGRGETRMPTIIGEAHDTHLALAVLQDDVRLLKAVQLFWPNEGKGMRWMGRMMACGHETAKARLLKGSEIHQAEIHRRTDAHKRMVEVNSRTLAESIAHGNASHARTGSVGVVKSLMQVQPVAIAIDKAQIRQYAAHSSKVIAAPAASGVVMAIAGKPVRTN